jgi:DNA-binding IclR family transcriptional regulator
MFPTHAQILQIVNAAPAGLTTRQIAEKLDMAVPTVSGVVSKLAAYGHIAKEPLAGRCKTYLWKPRQARPST